MDQLLKGSAPKGKILPQKFHCWLLLNVRSPPKAAELMLGVLFWDSQNILIFLRGILVFYVVFRFFLDVQLICTRRSCASITRTKSSCFSQISARSFQATRPKQEPKKKKKKNSLQFSNSGRELLHHVKLSELSLIETGAAVQLPMTYDLLEKIHSSSGVTRQLETVLGN